MSENIEEWLSQLPTAHECPSEGILLVGTLAPSAPEVACVVVGGFCFVFRRADILDIEIQDCSQVASQPQTIRVVVRKGAPLMNAFPSDIRGESPTGRRPFALSSRQSIGVSNPCPRFRALEDHFLRKHSLLGT
jgi:hypothetical protein